MIKLIIASLLSLAVIINFTVSPAFAKSEEKIVIDEAIGYLSNKEACFSLEKSVLENLLVNPESADSIISSAILMVGSDSNQIQNILHSSINAFIPAYKVRSIAITNHVSKSSASAPYSAIEEETFKECSDLADIVKSSIITNPELAPSILAVAIAMVGTESAKVKDIILSARHTGIDPDLVTAIAIANNIDPTLASEETSAYNNSNRRTNQAGYTPSNSKGGNGGGGGAGGISEHKKYDK
ncbi:hypothetical protein KO527_07970 [Pseudoalteromonas sp. C2R02]|uniref:hypothetical protein n=1 Tax=Pseudoalteromonas sp. C2R02 TaxID=2841565 RepID=UPI001C09AF1C|nr:hypothetical protein [Pseudoalteromonas sp. C2R02]MBU2969280.1 hypothetical protein [Pseudoalteromonas sp. C2R02]